MDGDSRPHLVHFDAHPDLVVPPIDPVILYDRTKLIEELSIENWIMPLCATGLITDISWIKQDWARQIPVGDHSFRIGITRQPQSPELGDEVDRLAVDSKLEYFVGEGNVVESEKELRESHPIQLKVIDLNTGEVTEKSLSLKPNQPIILDIDLDFYSTNNPFWDLYKKAGLYAELRPIYQFQIYETQFNKSLIDRRKQLRYLKMAFDHLAERKSWQDFPGKDHELFPKLEYLLKVLDEHYDLNEIDFPLIHDAGCTWDTYGLPDHRSTEVEIDEALKKTETFLRSLPDPVIITISRSSEDDYCPADQVEVIQRRVLEVLRNVYGSKLTDNPEFYYENEEC